MRPSYLPTGTVIARYELVRPIGSGGNAVVYEASDSALGRRVALKVRPASVGELTTRDDARFLREARAAAHVAHPHVVSVFDFGIDGDLVFLVMELVEGETLSALLRREGALSLSRTLEILLPVLSATAELHAQGILHRDLKPGNVLLRRGDDPFPKVTDFGLSQFVEEASTLTESGVTIGTPEYMAPEVMRDSHQATERSDLYALGVMLYECATGTRPFRGATSYEIMRAAVRGRAAHPSTLEPALPREFDRIVIRAMHRNAAKRFESVDELMGALFALAPSDLSARWVTDRSTGQPATRRRERLPEQESAVWVGDGVALTARGDVISVLWKASARMDRVRWVFDATDRIASRMRDGFAVLVILLPSSSPPDAGTTVECMKRMRKLRPAMRRQATVAVGGGIWQSVIRHAFNAMMLPLGRAFTISGSIADGIGRLLEKKRDDTPSFREMADDAVALYEALGLDVPNINAESRVGQAS